MHTIAVPVHPPMPAFELAVPVEVFGTDRPYLGVPWYDFKLCAVRPGPVAASGGFAIQAPYTLDDVVGADTVVVPACEDQAADPPAEIVEAVAEAYRRGARIASICSGAFLLAEAGILDGRPATTHWLYADELARRYPAVRVDPSVLYIDDGDVLTSAGTAAGLDLCLHLVACDHGARVAAALGKRLVVAPHRSGGQAQFVELPEPQRTDSGLSAVLDWALDHLGEPLTVADLAARAHISPRTLIRRFHAEIGRTPGRWLTEQRIRVACGLLESGDDTIERIAARTGFGTAGGMRRHFARLVGVSPHDYRRTFRA